MATVLFKRKTATEISSLPTEDGSLIFNTTDKDILMDNGTERERYGGGNLSTTDIVNDVATAIAVTETDVPAGCGTIKELNTSIVAMADPTMLQKTSAASAALTLLNGNKISDYKMIAVALLYQGSVRAITYYPKSSFLSYSVYAYAGTYIGSATYVSDTSVTLACSNTSWETRLLGYK